MTSLLVDGAVTTLIHDRLRILHDALTAKARVGSWSGSDVVNPDHTVDVVVTPVERQVLELARRALAVFEAGDRAPVAPGAPRTRTERVGAAPVGTSKFAYLGTAAFELPAWADLRSRRNTWMTHLLRGGNPDPALARVVAPATDFAFACVDRAIAAADGDAGTIAAARAFGMGMIGAVASDVVVGPLARGAEGVSARDGIWPAVPVDQLGRIESAVRRHVFGGASTTDFQDYWPEEKDVADALFTGYLEAFAGVRTAFPDAGTAPDVKRLRQAYRLFRHGIRKWERWQWFLWLFWYTAPIGAILAIAAAPSESSLRWQASRLFRPESPATPTTPAVDNPDEEAVTQLATLSFALSSIGPFVTTLWLWGDLPDMKRDFIHGTAAFGLDVAGAGLLAASLLTTNRWPAGVRWLIVILLAVSRIVFLFRAGKAKDPASKAYFLIQSIPLWSTIVTLLLAYLANEVTDDATGEPKRNRDLILVLWPVVLVALQLILSLTKLHGMSLLSAVTDGITNPFPPLDDRMATDPQWARAALLDESTLWTEAAPADPPSLANLRYPHGSSRKLLKLWWTGDGALAIRHRGRTLEFRIGNADPQVLALPPVAFTPGELAQWLAGKVTGRPPGVAGAAGGLHAEPTVAGESAEATHRLPWPEVLVDSVTFQAVGGDREHAYELHHASRAQLVTPHGRYGPAASVAEGWPVAPGPGLAGADGTAVGLAAELGTLLALGAASRIHDPAAVPVGAPAVGTVAQVFRRWNLDARRVNEWRMLIAGGARSEKGSRATPAPIAATPAVLPAPAAPTETVPVDPALPAGAAPSPVVLQGTEALCNDLGWVPLFRSWTRVAADVEQDAASDLPAPYNPRLRAEDGRWVQPTNRQLTDAVRYLLDLA